MHRRPNSRTAVPASMRMRRKRSTRSPLLPLTEHETKAIAVAIKRRRKRRKIVRLYENTPTTKVVSPLYSNGWAYKMFFKVPKASGFASHNESLEELIKHQFCGRYKIHKVKLKWRTTGYFIDAVSFDEYQDLFTFMLCYPHYVFRIFKFEE